MSVPWFQPEPGYKEKPFARKMMILNSTRTKTNGCRIPPRLSAFNHLGRKQITNNSSSGGLPEIVMQAAAERYTENVPLWPEPQSNRLGQSRRKRLAPGGCPSSRAPAAEPQLPLEVPKLRAGLGWSHMCHMCWVHEGQPSSRMVVLALNSFKVLTSCRQLQKSNQDFWGFFL